MGWVLRIFGLSQGGMIATALAAVAVAITIGYLYIVTVNRAAEIERLGGAVKVLEATVRERDAALNAAVGANDNLKAAIAAAEYERQRAALTAAAALAAAKAEAEATAKTREKIIHAIRTQPAPARVLSPALTAALDGLWGAAAGTP